MQNQIQIRLVKNDWLPASWRHGWGNGYVGVPPGHPWHGKDYSSLTHVCVHGGLTYADRVVPVGGEGPREIVGNLWWLGFDTAHSGDDMENCPREYVEQCAERLKQKAIEACEEVQRKAEARKGRRVLSVLAELDCEISIRNGIATLPDGTTLDLRSDVCF